MILNKRQLKKLAKKIIKENRISHSKLRYCEKSKSTYFFHGHCDTTMIEVSANRKVVITSNVDNPPVSECSTFRVYRGKDFIY